MWPVPTLSGSLTTLDSVVHPLLTAGDVYWFTATCAAEPQGHGGIWQDNFGNWIQDFAGEPPGAIELDSVAATAPATWGMRPVRRCRIQTANPCELEMGQAAALSRLLFLYSRPLKWHMLQRGRISTNDHLHL